MTAAPPGMQRLELLSDAWIAEAREYLRRAAPEVHFSFCETFTDPPPGVHAAWHVRLRPGHVEARPGEAADTDLRVEADYQAMLPMVQTPYAAGADALARTRREMAHRHGPDVMRMTGGAPAEVQPLLAGLHDHMAARTIENPHIEHRTDRLSLRPHVAELRDHGRTVIASAISPAFADELRERVTAALRELSTPTVSGLLVHDRLFEEIALDPLARTAAQCVLGGDIVLHGMTGRRAAIAPPATDPPAPAAADAATDGPGRPDPLVVVASWVLDDPTEDGGRPSPPKGALLLRDAQVRAEAPHGRTVGGRTVLEVAYCQPAIAPADDVASVGAEVSARNGPTFLALLGRDGALSARAVRPW